MSERLVDVLDECIQQVKRLRAEIAALRAEIERANGSDEKASIHPVPYFSKRQQSTTREG